MTCDQARAAISARMDGELAAADCGSLDEHLQDCEACRSFAETASHVRHGLRFEVVASVPDVTTVVLTRLREDDPHLPHLHPPDPNPPDPNLRDEAGRRCPELSPRSTGGRSAIAASARRHRRWLPAAAAFVVGFAIGGLAVTGNRTPAPQVAEAASLPDRVTAAQVRVQSLDAAVSVIENGRSDQVASRQYAGRLRYRAPEAMALSLREASSREQIDVVAEGGRWWTRGPRPCDGPFDNCDRAPAAAAVEGRAPFSRDTRVPLDLIVPAQSFARARDVQLLGDRTIESRRTVGVATTAAQLGPLLDGLRVAGDLRPLFPSDRVEVWLDADSLVPLLVDVRASDDPTRRFWQDRHGLADTAGQLVLELRLQQLRVNEPLAEPAFPPPPEGTPVANAGFTDSAAPPDRSGTPGYLPDGFLPYRSGTIGDPRATVRSWVDGRAWVTITSTEGWKGSRLFGDIGPLVQIDALANGVAYRDGQSSTFAIHGDDVDVVVSGTVAPAELRKIAESLPVRGIAVPRSWPESSTSSLAEARRADPGLLVPTDLAGFDAQPAVRVDGITVTMAYAGAGARAFTLSQGPGDRLSPPDRDVMAVQVRGTLAGRYALDAGELEWTDGGRAFSLRTSTLSLGELLAIAKRLAPP